MLGDLLSLLFADLPIVVLEKVFGNRQYEELLKRSVMEIDLDEVVISAIWASGVRIGGEERSRSGVLVATSARVMFASGKETDGRIFSFPYGHISNLEFKGHFFSSEIRFLVSGELVEFKHVNNHCTDLVEAIEVGISGRIPGPGS